MKLLLIQLCFLSEMTWVPFHNLLPKNQNLLIRELVPKSFVIFTTN